MLVRILLFLLFAATTAHAGSFKKPVKWVPGQAESSRAGYDESGRIVVHEARGKVVRTAHDDKGRVIKQQLSDGHVVEYKYDERGRRNGFVEHGVESHDIYGADGRFLGAVAGRTEAERKKAADLLGLSESGKRSIEYAPDGRPSQTRIGAASLVNVYGGSGELTRIIEGDGWQFAQTQRSTERGLELRDSAGNVFTSSHSGKTFAVRHGEDLIAAWEFEGNVISKIRLGGMLEVAYKWGKRGEWIEKRITSSSRLLQAIENRDYPDPELASLPLGTTIAPTGGGTARVRGGKLSYELRSAVRPVVGSKGELLYYSIFFAEGRFADDELRLLPDGSALFLPAAPYGSYSSVARTVRPVTMSLPAFWRPTKRMSSSANDKIELTPFGSSRVAPVRLHASLRPNDVVSPFWWVSVKVCTWIPSGSVSSTPDDQIADPSTTTTNYEGDWVCNEQVSWWVEDPFVSEPIDDSGGACDYGLTYWQEQNVSQGREAAQYKLQTFPECSPTFDFPSSLNTNGSWIIEHSVYLDGSLTEGCIANSNWAAYTEPGHYVVYLCGDRFYQLSDSGRAITLIHEALHSAGLLEQSNECPTCMTSEQITDMVRASCGG